VGSYWGGGGVLDQGKEEMEGSGNMLWGGEGDISAVKKLLAIGEAEVGFMAWEVNLVGARVT